MLCIILVLMGVCHASARAQPKVVFLPGAPFGEVPQPPPTASADVIETFAAATDHLHFERARLRHLRRLKKLGASDQRITQYYNRSTPRILSALRTMIVESKRALQRSDPTQAPYLAHLQVWLRYRETEMRWDSQMAAAEDRDNDAAVEALADGPDHRTTTALLASIVAGDPSYPGHQIAMMQYATLLRSLEQNAMSLQVALALVCPNQLRSTESGPPYQQCRAEGLSKDLETMVWMHLVGAHHFERTGELPRASAAYARAVTAGGADSAHARYLLGWSYYRQDQYDDALAAFFGLLEAPDGAATDLASEAATYAALSILDQWEQSPDGRSLLVRAKAKFSGRLDRPYVIQIVLALASAASDLQLAEDAAALQDFARDIRDAQGAR